MLNIDEAKSDQKIALFNSGFRVFFLAAGVFAVLSMLFWLLMYSLNIEIGLHRIVPLTWHAHEMVYGYSLAVVSGFLLTATTNWTNRKTLTGWLLFICFSFWLLARVSVFLPVVYNLELAFVFETLFFIMLIAGIFKPIVQSRQWKQLPVILPVMALLITNVIYYAGHFKIIENGVQIGLYAGFYLLLTLVFVMGRRVIPFFIEKGVDNGFKPVNYLWMDVVIIPVFLAYALTEILHLNPLLIVSLAAVLFALNLLRLSGWYTGGIWKKPLLWILLVAYFFITLGFGLRVLSYFINIPVFLIFHSMAVGGVGLLTVGMMSRVALGHSGRNVFEPPEILVWIFSLIFFAALFRVVLPVMAIEYYSQWVIASQLLWIAGFSLFTAIFAGMLIKPRLDGRPG